MSGLRRGVGRFELSLPRSRSKARAAEARAGEAERSRSFRVLVRIGFLARALTYAVVGGLALALAAGAGTDGTAPDQQGALTLIAGAPLGAVALAVLSAGLLAYAIWKLIQAAAGHGPEGGGGSRAWDRVSNGAGGVAYLIFFSVALRVLLSGATGGGGGRGGGSGSDSGQTHHAAAGVLAWPAGPWLVGAGGLALIAVSLYQIWDAISGRFAEQAKTEQMAQDERRRFLALGRVGITARALVFVPIGYFLVRTAIAFDPRSAVGVDGALVRLHHQAFGPWIVGLSGAGLLVFAGYSLLEGRYRRL